jgi:hypothetical protein
MGENKLPTLRKLENEELSHFLPSNAVVSQTGIREVLDFLETFNLVSGSYDMTFWRYDWTWQTTRGKLPKRLLAKLIAAKSDYKERIQDAHRAAEVKLDSAREELTSAIASNAIADVKSLCREITEHSRILQYPTLERIVARCGDLARVHVVTESSTWFYKFVSGPFNWGASDYGQDGSCWFGSGEYGHSAEAFGDMGGYAVLFFDGSGYHRRQGIGRAWVWEVSESAWIVFNGYHDEQQNNATREIARMLANVHGCEYRKIGLEVTTSYVNSECGFYVGHNLKDLPSNYTIEMEGGSCYTCAGCHESVSEDYSFCANDETYCESCYSENFTTCERCDDTTASDDAEAVITRFSHRGNTTQTWCRYCARNYASECDRCDAHYSDDTFSRNVQGENWCEECAEDSTHCEECDEDFPSSDVNEFDNRMLCNDCFSSAEIELAEELDTEDSIADENAPSVPLSSSSILSQAELAMRYPVMTWHDLSHSPCTCKGLQSHASHHHTECMRLSIPRAGIVLSRTLQTELESAGQLTLLEYQDRRTLPVYTPRTLDTSRPCLVNDWSDHMMFYCGVR